MFSAASTVILGLISKYSDIENNIHITHIICNLETRGKK